MNPILKSLATQVLSGLVDDGGNRTVSMQGLGSGEIVQSVITMFLKPSGTGAPTAGLQGLISQFQNAGLDDLVGSWLSTGPNKAISPDKILNALGPDTVQKFANASGMKAEDAAGSLADILPNLINHLSPSGQVDEALVKRLLAAVA
jgi:uncharacterized protein YidB (DUF937 family)